MACWHPWPRVPGPLGAIMAEHHPGLVLEPLLGPVARDAAAFRVLAAAFLAMDTERLAALSLRYKTGIEECVFILTNLLRPVMSLLRERSAAFHPRGRVAAPLPLLRP